MEESPYVSAPPRARHWHCWFCRQALTPQHAYGAVRGYFADLSDPGAEWEGRWFHLECLRTDPIAPRIQAALERLYGPCVPLELWWCLMCGEQWTDAQQRADALFRIPILTVDRAHPVYAAGHRYVHRACIGRWPLREAILEYAGAIRYPSEPARETLRVFRAHRSTSRFHCFLGAPTVLYPDGLPGSEDSEVGKKIRIESRPMPRLAAA